MTNAYDAPEYAGDMPDEAGQKLSQADANYRRGTPMRHCGVCMYYEGEDTQSCSKVDGPISGFGVSDVFVMQKNPFGSTIGPREAQMINGMMASGPDQSPQVAQTQIGSRTY